ncbi:MAG: hypothetical protein IPK99_17355 [Flavobacteriales bacterium]|nr:hypothetical protein [Flavobacteriales bacterium]
MGDAATWAAVLVALGGVLVALIQFRALKAANATAAGALRAAKRSNKQTKRSVDAYIDATRGKVVHISTGEMKEDGRVNFAFKNVGSAPVHISEMVTHHQVILKGGAFEEPNFPDDFITNYPLERGYYLDQPR